MKKYKVSYGFIAPFMIIFVLFTVDRFVRITRPHPLDLAERVQLAPGGERPVRQLFPHFGLRWKRRVRALQKIHVQGAFQRAEIG